MIPTDIGLPTKFTSWRSAQFEAAVNIAANNKRFVLESMPTGAGKSIIYMAVAKLLEARTLVLTANKGLQQQLLADFGGIGLTDIRGQGNYQCRALSHRKGFHGCDQGPCHFGRECEYKPRYDRVYQPGCEFYDQVARARKARLVVTNYSFWMSANRYMGGGSNLLGQFDLLVLDEAHDAADKLAEFCVVHLDKSECEEFLDAGLPPVEDGTDAWVSWAMMHHARLLGQIEHAKMFMGDDIETIKRMTDLATSLEFMKSAHTWKKGEPSDPEVTIPGLSSDWVGEKAADGKSATFSPVWAHGYAERWIFSNIKRVVLVSATIMPQTARYLGIGEKEFEYHEHPSGFHPDRRPVYFVPCASIGRKSTDVELRAQMVKVDQIISARLDRKGIIHTHSYDRAYQVRMSSQYKQHMVWHRRGEVQQAVEKYKAAGSGNYLISPSVEQGFDFPYAECEFQIVAKVPFPDTRSAVMKARIRSDKKYQNYLTAMSLIQMCGRGMRAEDDKCETFVLDDNIYWFHAAAKGTLPKWFRAAIRMVKQLPPVAARIEHR